MLKIGDRNKILKGKEVGIMVMISSCAFRTALVFIGESREIKLEHVGRVVGYGWV